MKKFVPQPKFVLQPTDRSFQSRKGDPEIYQTLQEAFDSCKMALKRDLDYFRRKRGGSPYSEHDVCLHINGRMFALRDPLDQETIDAVVDKRNNVKVVSHYCNDIQCYLMSVVKV